MRPACLYAAWWSKQIGAQLVGLYVSDVRCFNISALADLSGSFGGGPYDGLAAQLRDLEDERAQVVASQCREILAEAHGAEYDFTFIHETGFLVDILRQCQAEYHGVVMGKRGENADFAQGHLGSMMERAVRVAHSPMLVTARAFQPVERILLACDGSDSSLKAVRYVIENDLARAADLSLVTVAEDRECEHYAGILRDAENMLKEAGISVSCQILGGEPEDAISAFVAECSVDMLLMGAYGHSRLRHFFIGSTTGEMMRRCKIPVLCFR